MSALAAIPIHESRYVPPGVVINAGGQLFARWYDIATVKLGRPPLHCRYTTGASEARRDRRRYPR